MLTINLKALIVKLNPLCRSTLEAATGLCLTQQHYNVELQHWLLTLLDNDKSDIALICKHFDINREQLSDDLRKNLERFKSGNDQTPTISQRIIDLIRQSWLIASLDYQHSNISSAILFYSLLSDQTLQQLCAAMSAEFNKISPSSLQLALPKLLSHSQERPSTSSVDKFTKLSKTPALDQFTINLNQQARSGAIDAVIGRENEVRQIIDILSRRRQNNAILTGEPGVGKTAIVEGLALRIVNGDVPEGLQQVIIRTLDLGLLQAGAGIKGEFENRLKEVMKEVKSSPQKIILFIDEAHLMIGAGSQAGSSDAANLLKPALARGELRTIAATTWAEYKKYFEQDAALTRRFQVVKVEEPTENKAIHMLRSMVSALEQHHQVKVLDEAVVNATRLANRYITARQLPDKSISVLDTACARVASKQAAIPAIIEDYRAELTALAIERNNLEIEAGMGISHEKRIAELYSQQDRLETELQRLETTWQQEKELVTQIIDLQKQLPSESPDIQQQLQQYQTELKALQKDNPLIQSAVDAQVVAEVIADWTGIPVGKMLKDELNHILQLKDYLAKRVIGQPHSLELISRRIHIARAKLSDPNKPLGVFLFVGPSGVGKTETALALAEHLFGSEKNLTVINMSEYKEEHKTSLLMGSPPGYVGYGEGGVLTEAIRRHPYRLLLLDEMEKAHSGVQDIFYQVFDKGMLQDGQGRDIDFKNTLIIMTSNVCSDYIDKATADPNNMPSIEELTNQLHSQLTEYFKPAFLGRVTVVPYLPLADEMMTQIINLQMQKIQKRVADNHQATLTYNDEFSQAILARCQHSATGARQIDDCLTRHLLPALSEKFLSNMTEEKHLTDLEISVDEQGEFSIRSRSPSIATEPRTQ